MTHQKFITSKIVYGVLIATLLLSLWFFLRPQTIAVETAKMIRGDFEEVLRTDGIIKAKKKLTVQARAVGDLDRIDLKVGQEIKKGQKITTLLWDFRETIKSPLTGIVAKVYRESAGPVNRGDPLIDIINPEDLQVEAEVLTTDAVRIPAQAEVKIYGLGNELIQFGTVENVSHAGFVKLSALGIEEEKTITYIKIKNPNYSLLGDTYHVELSILIDSKKNVAKLPIGAIFKNKNQWSVYVISKNKAHLKNIEILNRNDTEVVLDQPLQEDEQVILFPGDQITEGTSVKPLITN